MKQSTIEIVTPHGSFVNADGTRMKKWIVTFADNHDGLAFSSAQKPWWNVGDVVWYEITGHTNGMDHVRIRRTNKNHNLQNTVAPFTTHRKSTRWMWAIEMAVRARKQPENGPNPVWYADIQADAIRFEMMLEQLETK